MRTLAALLLVAVLAGCAVSDVVPSLKYCEGVQYVRKGNNFAVFFSECRVP
jgi:hypothetical protein